MVDVLSTAFGRVHDANDISAGGRVRWQQSLMTSTDPLSIHRGSFHSNSKVNTEMCRSMLDDSPDLCTSTASLRDRNDHETTDTESCAAVMTPKCPPPLFMILHQVV